MNLGVKAYFGKNMDHWNSYQECYDYHYNDLMKYHNKYGKDGFLSERTYAENIPSRAKTQADHDWEMQQAGAIVLDKARVDFDDPESFRKVEQQPDFIEWANPGDITVSFKGE